MKKYIFIACMCFAISGLTGCGSDEVDLVEVEIEQIPENARKQNTSADDIENDGDGPETEGEITSETDLADASTEEATQTVVISEETKSEDGRNILRVAVVGSPATEIIELADKSLEYTDYCLEAIEFKNYNEVNDRIRSGEIYASLCENQVLLESYNNINDTNLTLAERVFISPLAIFPCKEDNLKNVSSKAVIAVSKGDVNVARALYLLEQKGLIEIKEGAMYQATMEDVTSNPHGIIVEQVDLDQGWPDSSKYAFVIADYNRAVLNGVDPQTSIGEENRNSKIFDLFAVGLVVKADNVESDKTKLILDAINSDDVEDMIENSFYGSVLDYK